MAKMGDLARGWGKYCSRKCANLSLVTAREYECARCGKRFSSYASRSRTRRQYCSQSCYQPGSDGIIALLTAKIAVSHDTGCWEWQGTCNRFGYGQVWYLRQTRLVHRVSAAIFAGFDLFSKADIAHKCDNRRCYNPDHLFITDAAGNIHDAVRKGRHSHGERSAQAKLTEADVQTIRARHANGELFAPLALEFGVSQRAIRSVVSRETWKHVP